MMNSMQQSARSASNKLQSLAGQEKTFLANSLDALKSALTSEQGIHHSLSLLRNRGGDFSQRAALTVRKHPLATVLSFVGIGFALYSWRRYSRTDWSEYHQSNASYGVDPDYVDEFGEPLASVDEVGRHTRRDLSAARRRMEELGDGAVEAAQNVGDKAYQTAQHLRDSSESVLGRLQRQSKQLTGNARDTIRQHPVATGVLGVALGAAIGGAIYNSRRNRTMALANQSFGTNATAFLAGKSASAKKALRSATNRILH